MAFRRHMSAIRSQAEVQAQLSEGPGCANNRHCFDLEVGAPSRTHQLLTMLAELQPALLFAH